MKLHMELEHTNVWTEQEQNIFFEGLVAWPGLYYVKTNPLFRYMTYQKKFAKIKDRLPNKSIGECVLFYYRTKKMLKYKEKVCNLICILSIPY